MRLEDYKELDTPIPYTITINSLILCLTLAWTFKVEVRLMMPDDGCGLGVLPISGGVTLGPSQLVTMPSPSHFNAQSVQLISTFFVPTWTRANIRLLHREIVGSEWQRRQKCMTTSSALLHHGSDCPNYLRHHFGNWDQSSRLCAFHLQDLCQIKVLLTFNYGHGI